MKKIYLVNWATSHDGFVYNGCVLAPTLEKADKEMRKLYKQSRIQVSPDGDGKNLSMDDYTKEQSYYVSNAGDECWERAEITSKVININELENA